MEVSPLIDSVWRDDELRAELPPSDEIVGTGDTKLELDRYALGPGLLSISPLRPPGLVCRSEGLSIEKF
jgi:hypothetical protein